MKALLIVAFIMLTASVLQLAQFVQCGVNSIQCFIHMFFLENERW